MLDNVKYVGKMFNISDTRISWPSGSYGLPKSILGCPDMWNEGWRKQDLEDDQIDQSKLSSSFHMDAVLTNDYIKRYFCIKTRNYEQHKSWPKGRQR